jgi:antitoxin component YwqK of YwqJK toxin-antitoxin module
LKGLRIFSSLALAALPLVVALSGCMERTTDDGAIAKSSSGANGTSSASAAGFGGAAAAINLDDTRIRVSWTLATGLVAGYRIYEFSTSGTLTALQTMPPIASSYIHAGLTPCSEHNYVVRAVAADNTTDTNLNIVSAMTYAGATSVNPLVNGMIKVNFPACANASAVNVYCKLSTDPAFPATPSAAVTGLSTYANVTGAFTFTTQYVCKAAAVQADTGIEDGNFKTVTFAACPGLLGYWDADASTSTSTVVVDRASTNNGTYASGTTAGQQDQLLTSNGNTGYGFLFNGSSQSITVPTTSTLNFGGDFTISLWLKSTTALPSAGKVSSIISKTGYSSATAFATAANWSTVDVSSAAILNSASYKGFVGGTFDGRYLYLAPNYNTAADGFVARYDTLAAFNLATSWQGVDITSATILNSANYKGFQGTVFDGRYVYYVPSNNGAVNGFVARYDTQGSFTAGSSWAGVDITTASILNNVNYKGFLGAVFDGRYIYLVPYNNGAVDGFTARYDTQGAFTDAASWTGVDLTSLGTLGAKFKGFEGGVFDGRYVYYVPYSNGAIDGYVARYDTQGAFASAGSWQGIDISSASILNSATYRGFVGGVFDGRYVYLVPYTAGSVARFDTQGTFSSATSWSGVDLTSASYLNSVNYKNFIGGTFDGRYVYFIPYTYGNVARYDTQATFNTGSSWSGVDITSASIFNSASYKGFSFGSFDGRYVYYVPYNNGAYHGNVVRFDTTDSAKRAYSLTSGSIDSAGGIRFRLETDAGYYSVKYNSAIAANTWTHVAVRYTRNTALKLYVNGSEVDSTPAAGVVPSSVADLLIGKSADSGLGYFNGSLDEVMFFDHALAPSEITTLAAPANVCR